LLRALLAGESDLVHLEEGLSILPVEGGGVVSVELAGGAGFAEFHRHVVAESRERYMETRGF
jgi:hypothetical protein